MKIGYARVSTEDQKLDLQIHALKSAGCDQIFSDHGLSGSGFDRPGLATAISKLCKGDMLVVWRLDRLGRSLQGLIRLVDQLGKRGVEFQSLTESIDTATAGGRLIFHVMAALSEFERAIISERTRAGMEAARRKGRHVGRPPSLSPDEVYEANRAFLQRGESLDDIAKKHNVTPRTLRRLISKAGMDRSSGYCVEEM